jgi:predicted transcriptional regulator
MHHGLPRREREVLEALLSVQEGSAAAVRAAMKDPPGYSAVRTLLARLEGKGLVRHRVQDQTYIYAPAVERARAGQDALEHMVSTFFAGSAAKAAVALLGAAPDVSGEELDELEALIRKARAGRR